MENRFGVKDFVFVVLLVAVIATQWFTIVMHDRQWGQFAQIKSEIGAQTRDLMNLRRAVTDGVAVRPNRQSGQPDEQPDIFRRVRQVQARPDYALGDTLVDSFQSAPPKLNYLTSHDVYSRIVYYRILEPLANWDIEKIEVVPYLAERWEVADDGLSMDVWLRRNVIFSDGVRMDADDVIFTWGLLQNPQIRDGHHIEYLRHIQKVEKVDQYHVRFHFAKVFFENELRALEEPVLPKHFFERFTERQMRDSPAMVIGTGPYRLPDPEQYRPGQTIEVVRNERYWGPPGPWDRIVWRIIESESATQIAFQNDEVDLFLPTPEQHEQMVQDEALVERTQHLVYEHVRLGYTYIGWNQRRGGEPTIFADKRVRQAMTFFLDRQRVVEDVFLGYARVADGPFHPMGPQHNPQIEPWPFDPQRGLALLEEVGFKRRADGVMLKPDGTPFEVELTYPSGSDLFQKIMLFAKDSYARAGIHIKLHPLEWTLLLKNLNEKNFEAITLGWGAGGIEGDIEQMFHSRTIEEGDNRNAYSSPELDSLIEKAHVTLDIDERMKIWHRCHAILHEDQPYTFLFRQKARLWLDGRIHNVQQIPVLGINYVSTWPVPLEWYVPSDEQRAGGRTRSEPSPF